MKGKKEKNKEMKNEYSSSFEKTLRILVLASAQERAFVRTRAVFW
jgi:hypothetical protein